MPMMSLRNMKPFRERNAAVIGAVSLALIAAMLLLATQASKLPIVGGGPVYAADFTEVGGLKKGDDVRLAGVKVGEVDGLELKGNTVRVRFRVKSDRDKLGSQTQAAVRIKSLLGTMYVSLDPEGAGLLEPGSVIPTARTRAPYDIVQAFSGLTETTQQIDTEQLKQALDTVNEVTAKTPEGFREAVTGVTALSKTIADRDQQIKELLANVDSISGVIADRNAQFIQLFEDGGVLFDALSDRRDAIHQVLVGTREMSQELDGLITDSKEDLRPALTRLAAVVKVLEKNEKSLQTAIDQMPAFYAMIANGAANGPWLEGYAENLVSIILDGNQ